MALRPYHFAEELAQWGPESHSASGVASSPTIAEAESYTRWLAESHYENFPVVTRLLPSELRQHFRNVYAFCRWADDLGDEVVDPAESLRLLAWWRHELHQCYAGSCRHPVFVALHETVQKFRVPLQPFDDLISAFESDQTTTHYETFDQLLGYCRCSANPVGRIVLSLCGVDTLENRELSDAICTGLQLANFWQDVARDADISRVYLPVEDRRQHGYSDDDMQRRVTNDSFLLLMQFEVDRAKQYLLRGLPLADRMPGRLRIDIELFAQGGLAIVRKIEQIGYRVWETRPVLTRWDFAKLMGRVVCRRATAWTRRRSTMRVAESSTVAPTPTTEEQECPSA
ncbi:MAG: squalene synthase HpnC [Planctomycetaceae bacterium]